MASKRGYGLCFSCKREYCNKKKPKYCPCGFELGGSYTMQVKVPPPPESVNVFISEADSLRSVKVTPNDDRQFMLVSENGRLCYVENCLQLRAACNVSGKLTEFTCKHIDIKPEEPLYRLKFSDREFEQFTPDKSIQHNMKLYQASGNLPTVVKLSQKSYAVIGPVSTT